MDLRRIEKIEEANWRQTQVGADLTLDKQGQISGVETDRNKGRLHISLGDMPPLGLRRDAIQTSHRKTKSLTWQWSSRRGDIKHQR